MTQVQPAMIIAGIPEDKVFSHICYVANHLSQILPNFQYKRICIRREEWEPWLKKICETHNWSHSDSLLVWRKFGKRPGTAIYIGGATQFWEFISEYYGIESRLTKDELKTLSQDFLQETRRNVPENTSRRSKDKRLVAIFGENKSLCSDLAVELLLMKELHLAEGILIQICNAQLHDEKSDERIENDPATAVKIVQSMNSALINCDLLIVLNEILRKNEESTDDWLTRNRVATLELAALINEHAPANLRVIFCSNGPTCFNAGLLAVASTKLDTVNIVAVSGHEGLNILNEILKFVDVPLEEIGCPPVWGFFGVSRFIDICNAVQKHYIFRPNDRALKAPKGTTLPLGVKQPDLRSIFYLAHNKNPYLNISEHKVTEAIDLNFQKSKAICDLLKLWYNESCNSTNSEIISLGIRSDGTFGIPEGIFFSQPVYLKETNNNKKSRQWMPCPEFPVPNNPNWILSSMIETAKILVQKYIDPELLIATTISSTMYEDISQGDL